MPRVFVVLALWIACAPVEDAASVFDVPRPDLTSLGSVVSRQLEVAGQELEARLAEGLGGAESAAAIGELGRLYHAYDLNVEAEICYLEAERRDPDGDWSYYLGFLQQVGGDLEAAAASFDRFVERRPGDLAGLQRRADVLAQLGRAGEAAAAYRQVLDGSPRAAAALRGLGGLEAQAGRHDEAVAHLEGALELQPQATSIHYQLAQSLRAFGRVEEAERHAALAGNGQVRFDDPRVAALDQLAVGAGVRLARGGVALSQGQLAEALVEYQAAVEAEPENIAARTNLGLVLARAGRNEEAREQLEKAVKLDPSDPSARVMLASLRLPDDAAEARQGFETVLADQPDHTGALRGRIDASLALGDNETALSDLERLVQIEPGDGLARLQLGAVLQGARRHEEAVEQYRAALEFDLQPAQRAAAELSIANMASFRGEHTEALAHYDAAIEVKPDLVEAVHNRAGTLSYLGRHAEAVAAYERVLELDPGRDGVLLYLATALFQSGRTDEALETYRLATERSPEPAAHVGVAASLTALGREAEAVAALESSARLLPRSEMLSLRLAELLSSATDRSLRDGERALEILRELGLRESPLFLETLAMALAEAGRFSDAVEIQQRLIEFEDRPKGDDYPANPEYRARLSATLRLYESGESCCPPPS